MPNDIPNKYWPAAYWFWHSIPGSDEIRRQVREMCDAGLRTFLIQPRLAFPMSDYLSADYFEAYETAMRVARRLGMTAGIYDEYNFISGHAGGQTVQGHDELRERQLFWSTVEPQSGRVRCRVSQIRPLMFGPGGPEGNAAAEWLWEDGRVEWSDWQILASYAHRADNEAPLDITDQATLVRADADGCEVEVGGPLPPDATRVTVFVHARCATSRFINYLDPAASACFVELTHERYRQSVGRYFGDPIRFVFSDHPYAGFYDWAERRSPVGNSLLFHEGLPAAFETDHGYPLRDALPALVGPVGGRTARFRCHFFDSFGRLGRESYWGTIARWAHANGLDVSGHELLGHVGAWDFVSGFRWIDARASFGADYFAIDSYRTLTAVDASNYAPQLSTRLGASVAKAHGRRECIVEQYSVGQPGEPAPFGRWELTLGKLRAQAIRHLFFGATQFLFHAYYQTSGWPDDERPLLNPRVDFAPGINFEPYFGFHGDMAAELADIAKVRAGAPDDTRIGVLYPLATYWNEGPNGDFARHGGFWHRALSERGYMFDIVDERSLAQGEIADGEWRCTSGAYRLLVLPAVSTVLSAAFAARIEEFLRGGGRVIASGKSIAACAEASPDALTPDDFADLVAASPNFRRVADVPIEEGEADLWAWVDRAVGERLRVEAEPGEGVLWRWYGRVGQTHTVGLFNDSPLARRICVRVPDQQPAAIQRFSGAAGRRAWTEWAWRTEAGDGALLDLEPYEVAHLRMEPGDEGTALLEASGSVRDATIVGNGRLEAVLATVEDRVRAVVKASSPPSATSAGGRVEVRPLAPHLWEATAEASLPSSALLDRGWTLEVPGRPREPIRITEGWESQGYEEYSGSATYECGFGIDGALWPGSWALEIPHVGSSCEVRLNDVLIGRRAQAPYRFDVPVGLLLASDNVLRVTVWNTAANALYSAEARSRRRLVSGIVGVPALRPLLMLEIGAEVSTASGSRTRTAPPATRTLEE